MDYNIPGSVNITKVYPNPFNSQVTVDYEINNQSDVSVFVVDISGKKIKTIKQSQGSKGTYRILWSGDNDHGENVSSGLYFLSIKAGNTIRTAKVLLLE